MELQEGMREPVAEAVTVPLSQSVNKTQYFRLRLYDSDFRALSALYECSLIAL